MRAEIPPPAEKRVAIAGKFLDEVRIAQGGNTLLRFPVDRHRCVIGEDGTATVYAMMPSAPQLFAEGRLPSIGGAPVEVDIGGRKLGPMVLTEVRSAARTIDTTSPCSSSEPRPGPAPDLAADTFSRALASALGTRFDHQERRHRLEPRHRAQVQRRAPGALAAPKA